MGSVFSYVANWSGFVYVKWAIIAALVGGAAYLSWDVRSAYAEREKTLAVREAVRGAQKQIDDERALRLSYQTLADEKLAVLLKSISDIKAAQVMTTAAIKTERAKDPKFYNQPLPQGGYDEWVKARALAVSPPASSPQ